MTKTGDKATKGGQGKIRVEQDARGQFAEKKHGRTNNGVSSASPRVTSGTDDATTGGSRLVSDSSRPDVPLPPLGGPFLPCRVFELFCSTSSAP